MNTIKIYSNYTQTPVQIENTGAITLSDVQSALIENGADESTFSDSKFMVRQGGLQLSYSDSVVPAGNIHIMVSAAKNKGGAINGNDFLDESGKASGTRIVRALEAISQQMDEMKEELNKELDSLKSFTTQIAEEVGVELEEASLEDYNDEFEEEDPYAGLSEEDAEAMRELNSGKWDN